MVRESYNRVSSVSCLSQLDQAPYLDYLQGDTLENKEILVDSTKEQVGELLIQADVVEVAGLEVQGG